LQFWRGFAEILNTIINGMLPTWKDEAYIIYHVFAGMQALTDSMAGSKLLIIIVAKGHFLSRAARLSEARRKTFATSVVAALQLLPAPRGIEGVSFFNPVKILSMRLGKRYDSSDGSMTGLGLTLAK
jgi:hypothetical protein